MNRLFYLIFSIVAVAVNANEENYVNLLQYKLSKNQEQIHLQILNNLRSISPTDKHIINLKLNPNLKKIETDFKLNDTGNNRLPGLPENLTQADKLNIVESIDNKILFRYIDSAEVEVKTSSDERNVIRSAVRDILDSVMSKEITNINIKVTKKKYLEDLAKYEQKQKMDERKAEIEFENQFPRKITLEKETPENVEEKPTHQVWELAYWKEKIQEINTGHVLATLFVILFLIIGIFALWQLKTLKKHFSTSADQVAQAVSGLQLTVPAPKNTGATGTQNQEKKVGNNESLKEALTFKEILSNHFKQNENQAYDLLNFLMNIEDFGLIAVLLDCLDAKQNIKFKSNLNPTQKLKYRDYILSQGMHLTIDATFYQSNLKFITSLIKAPGDDQGVLGEMYLKSKITQLQMDDLIHLVGMMNPHKFYLLAENVPPEQVAFLIHREILPLSPQEINIYKQTKDKSTIYAELCSSVNQLETLKLASGSDESDIFAKLAYYLPFQHQEKVNFIQDSLLQRLTALTADDLTPAMEFIRGLEAGELAAMLSILPDSLSQQMLQVLPEFTQARIQAAEFEVDITTLQLKAKFLAILASETKATGNIQLKLAA